MDHASDPTTQAQIDQHVAQLAALNPTHITVDTPMDRPARYAMWVNSIRAHGKKVWHRPMDWGYPNASAATDPTVTPAIYLDRVRQFIRQNLGLFKPGDIFDGDSEADGNAYGASSRRRTGGTNPTHRFGLRIRRRATSSTIIW